MIYYIFYHRSLEVKALLKVAFHMVETLQVSVFSHVDSVAAELLIAILTLLLELLSITVKFTIIAQHDDNSMKIQKDDLIRVLKYKMTEWIKDVMSKNWRTLNPSVFGAGLSFMMWGMSKLEEFVDLHKEFKV